jgi:hypothetical protein
VQLSNDNTVYNFLLFCFLITQKMHLFLTTKGGGLPSLKSLNNSDLPFFRRGCGCKIILWVSFISIYISLHILSPYTWYHLVLQFALSSLLHWSNSCTWWYQISARNLPKEIHFICSVKVLTPHWGSTSPKRRCCHVLNGQLELGKVNCHWSVAEVPD